MQSVALPRLGHWRKGLAADDRPFRAGVAATRAADFVFARSRGYLTRSQGLCHILLSDAPVGSPPATAITTLYSSLRTDNNSKGDRQPDRSPNRQFPLPHRANIMDAEDQSLVSAAARNGWELTACAAAR